MSEERERERDGELERRGGERRILRARPRQREAEK